MMTVVRDDEGGPADGPEAFDRKVAEVLEAEAGMLSEKSERLLVTGSVMIERPAGVLNASLRPPRWWRAGVFRQSAVREDGAAYRGVVPLGRTMDETFGLGPLETFLHDPTVTDILINGPKTIFIERNGMLEEGRVAFHDDRIYIADTYNSKIKMLFPATGKCVTYLGGEPDNWFSGPTFSEPAGISCANDKLYVADTNAHRSC